MTSPLLKKPWAAHNSGLKMCIVLLLLAAQASFSQSTRRYVKPVATGTGTGLSWENASGDLQAMLSTYLGGQQLEVWIAGGTYKPSRKPGSGLATPNDRDNSFTSGGSKVYGGFAGTEISLEERDLSITANATILSGDFNDDDTYDANGVITGGYADNAVHVWYGVANLDGLTIKGGSADASGSFNNTPRQYGGGIYIKGDFSVPYLITIRNCIVTGNRSLHTLETSRGGGIYKEGNVDVIFENVTITGNSARAGGGIYTSGSAINLTFINSTIKNNIAQSGTGSNNGYGGGLYIDSPNVKLFNSFILNNTADKGGAFYCGSNGVGVLYNCIVANNTALIEGGAGYTPTGIYNSIVYNNSSGVYTNSGLVPAKYSILQGNNYQSAETNLPDTTDPLFTDAVNGDYTLQAASPCINAGGNIYYFIMYDYNNMPRLRDDVIDIGPYEKQEGSFADIDEVADANGIVYVKNEATGLKDGSSWANATSDLQGAIDAAGVRQVWVAAGTYRPKGLPGITDPKDYYFLLKNNVQVYGGFAGTEMLLSQRNPDVTVNESILNGENLAGGKAYHLVLCHGKSMNTLLNGFTLKNINGNGPNTYRYVDGVAYNRSIAAVIYSNGSNAVFSQLKTSATIYASEGNPALENVYINGPGFGKNIHIVYSNVSLYNVVSVNADYGLYLMDGLLTVTNLTNCTISNNNVGIYLVESNLKAANTIIYGNETEFEGISATFSLRNSLVKDHTITGPDGNLDGATNPMFTDPEEGDYTLQPGSACIDSGNNLYITSDEDVANNNRIRNDIVDMGAFEEQSGAITSVILIPDDLGIIYVKPAASGIGNGSSWENATSNLQGAMQHDTAQQVWVAHGTYVPVAKVLNKTFPVWPKDRKNAFSLRPGIKVYGGFTGSEEALEERDITQYLSILSGDLNNNDGDNFTNTTDNSVNVVNFLSDISGNYTPETVLDGFAIRDSSEGAEGSGMTINTGEQDLVITGGVYCLNASPTLSNLFITKNAANFGSGMYNRNSSPVLDNVIVTDNKTMYEGGWGDNLNGGAVYNFQSSPVISNSTISNNECTGIINMSNSSPLLNNSVVSYNSAVTSTYDLYDTNQYYTGGGIANINSSPTLVGVEISYNTTINNDYNGPAENTAGGMYNYHSSPVLINVVIKNNTSDNYGGGMGNYEQSAPVCKNVLISNNQAGVRGGGIVNTLNSTVTLNNATIVNNTSLNGELLEGIYNGSFWTSVSDSSTVTLNNSIVYGNTPVVNYGLSASLMHNTLVQDFTTADANNNIAGTTNPLFTDATNADFTLQATSPVVNAGNNTYVTTGTDLNGNARIQQTTVDLGAYEYQAGCNTAAPTAETQEFCNGATVAALTALGTDIKWYGTPYAAQPLAGTEVLAGGTYYASQTISGCESPRTAVSVVINTPVAPLTTVVQNFYGSATVANLQAIGNNVQWYTSSAGGTALANTTILANGTYYASQTIDGCEGQRIAVTVSILPVPEPGGDADQEIIVEEGQTPTIDDIVIETLPDATVTWYATAEDALLGINPLPPGTPLVNGQTYYATQTVNGVTSQGYWYTRVAFVLSTDEFNTHSFTSYPNPVTDVLTLQSSNNITQVQVYDISGKLVITHNGSSNQVAVNLAALEAGSYMVKTSLENGVVKDTLIIKK
ncbi:hypothetical protein AM493_16275 [Flavobacterium akiainvivens]|uniref:Secretion system C-terminal sorting domain-containing protein n=1 Tax=Flavobacterium akiainvivens TaxID=1202724 RepID=A0A0M8MEU9_9FLAO|nr:choice-of-anchor Q domain-containing protein [Flavobacterium akiainvivens]KOS07424.1 hypothetical protein AM493_16275 [Flavobacterium akiainvivens]SFQ47993.1 Por secretion system C-terminal sorting domain-containing protein [Flavobacterium akiainvivens]